MKSKLNRWVFFPSAGVIFALVLFSILFHNYANELFTGIQSAIVNNMSWFYILVVSLILILAIYLGFSRYGDIRLGPDHSKPDYKFTTWLAMLFSAGMGIGLMFFGVSEPVMHFLSPPTADPNTVEAVKEAMRITFFHWGLHAWAIYAIVGLILAYFSYRHRLPLTLRSALYPLIGNRIYGWPGHLIDVFATVGTVFGVATSLGFGASQVNSGLNYLFQIPVDETNQFIIMVVVTALAAISVTSGLDKGVKRLSELNMILAISLMVLVFVLGPTIFLLQAYIQNIGSYLSDLVHDSFNLFAYQQKDWIGGWTIFYWGWWLAWAPFVGLFIARISRGRTIKEFIAGVILIPTLFTFLWMTIFGNGALHLIFNQGFTDLSEMVSKDSSVALFVFLSHFPWSEGLTILSLVMIVVFFVTSCDSGAMVIDMLCSNGRNDTPIWQRLFWAITVGLVAATLSFTGGLQALQTMTIAAALPFAIVLIIAMIGLMRSLNLEMTKRDSLVNASVSNRRANVQTDWRARLDGTLEFPSKRNVQKYVTNVVNPAIIEVSSFFEDQNIEARIDTHKTGIRFTVKHGTEQNFIYAVEIQRYIQPEFSYDFDSDDDVTYYRCEVHLSDGGQDYDIMGWNKNAVINDIVDQYQRHLHFLHVIR